MKTKKGACPVFPESGCGKDRLCYHKHEIIGKREDNGSLGLARLWNLFVSETGCSMNMNPAYPVGWKGKTHPNGLSQREFDKLMKDLIAENFGDLYMNLASKCNSLGTYAAIARLAELDNRGDGITEAYAREIGRLGFHYPRLKEKQ